MCMHFYSFIYLSSSFICHFDLCNDNVMYFVATQIVVVVVVVCTFYHVRSICLLIACTPVISSVWHLLLQLHLSVMHIYILQCFVIVFHVLVTMTRSHSLAKKKCHSGHGHCLVKKMENAPQMFNGNDVMCALVSNLIEGGVQNIVKVVALLVWIPLMVMFQALPKSTSLQYPRGLLPLRWWHINHST